MNMPLSCDAEKGHEDIVKFCGMVLPDNLFKQLEISSQTPYSDDYELYADYGMLHFLCSKANETRNKFSNSLGANELPLGVTLEEKQVLLEYLESTAKLYRKKIETRIRTTIGQSSNSSFLTLVEKLNLSGKEREAFAYMVNELVGNEFQSSIRSELGGLRSILYPG